MIYLNFIPNHFFDTLLLSTISKKNTFIIVGNNLGDVNVDSLYQEYSGMVYNIALQYVQNIEDAEEITQDVFVLIHYNLNNYTHQAHIKTWIYRIVINKSLDHIKFKSRQKRFSFITSLFTEVKNDHHFSITEFDHPGVMLEQKEAIKHIFDGINQLPSNQKTALILSKIEAKSQLEIAEIMELSPKAVESLIQRGKSKLKIILHFTE